MYEARFYARLFVMVARKRCMCSLRYTCIQQGHRIKHPILKKHSSYCDGLSAYSVLFEPPIGTARIRKSGRWAVTKGISSLPELTDHNLFIL